MARHSRPNSTYCVRVMFLRQDEPRGSGRSLPVERVLDSFEVEITDEAEGLKLSEDIADYIEDAGFDVLEEDK